ncbi:hypothetical protein C5610_03815 [Idiomarina sp. OT37-5b]|jgi:hypothetical protein|uniref:Uncharacterized protein n=1 Tax=Idiomarina aquatica TaxID=1327752 RepID=A0AA94EG62_9GAMM|nr:MULTISPECIES: hypothetical protein [Idiomarina]AVJ55505.1 hypothetical protein C5610_03815 [Idiomarina sp. OT37-5b]RUO44876.1 hypothetical protein CWE23_02250 [Idiomarina aquatica]
MADYETCLRNPAGTFGEPENVLKRDDLSKEQKLEILKQWRYDEYETEVADQENMRGDKPDRLGEINNLILKLEQ